MKSHGAAPVDRVLADRLARQRLVVTLACLAVSSCDLALSVGVFRGLGCFLGASLLATVVLRFAPGWRQIATAGGQSRAVFLSGLASTLAAPAWTAAIDPGSELAAMPWRHVGVLAVVWPGIGAVIAARWLAAERARCALDGRAASVEHSADDAIAPSARELGAAIGLVCAGLLVWLGEGVFLASTQGFGTERIAAAGAIYCAAAGLLALVASRWVQRLLALAFERARLDEAEAVDRCRREHASTIGSLAQRFEAIAALLGALAREREERSSDRGQAADAARALGSVTADAVENAGELTRRIEDLRRDVAGLRAAGGGLEEREGGFAHRIESTARGLVAIDQASRAMFDRMARIAAASRDSTTSLAELVDAMRTVDGAADSIHALSNELVTRAELGRTRFAEAVDGMEVIRAATQSAESIIRGLGARTREIGGILDVIDEVGDQTSLLALNAAIIAAQAGEHGRSFSVVAEEIRDLADRVLVSTKEIGGLIRSVQTESERAIGAIEAGSKSVQNGVALAAEVGRTLDEITQASRATSTRIASVATSVEKQSRILGRAVELSSRVAEAVREIESADVDRTRSHGLVAESMITLRDAAEELRTLVLDQKAGLARIDGELGFALVSARGLTTSLEGQDVAARDVLRIVEADGEVVRSTGSIDLELTVAREAIDSEIDVLRACAARTDFTPTRSSEPARARGEGS